MKKKLLALIIVFFILSANSWILTHAQESPTFIEKKEQSTAYLKNTVITIGNQIFDYRILKHYSEEDLRSLSSIKRKQVHFIYTESYVISNIGTCSNLTETDIDVSKIERFRKQSESAVVEYGSDCKVKVTLLSKDQLSQKLNQITD